MNAHDRTIEKGVVYVLVGIFALVVGAGAASKIEETLSKVSAAVHIEQLQSNQLDD